MEGKYRFSEEFLRESRRNGMSGQRPTPEEVGAGTCHSLSDNWEKPIPSSYQLIRITFYIALEWYAFLMPTLWRVWASKILWQFPSVEGVGKKVLCHLPPKTGGFSIEIYQNCDSDFIFIEQKEQFSTQLEGYKKEFFWFVNSS